MTPPPWWRVMCREALGLSEHLAWVWWRALSKSACAKCQEVRAALLRYAALPRPRPAADRQLMQALFRPAHLVQVLEALIQQGLLLRRDGVVIEDAILARLDSLGDWREQTPLDLGPG